MNPIMNLFGNSNVANIMMQGIGAALRGESPSDFLKNLARTEPKLQKYNYDDLERTAKVVCDDNNVNMEEKKKEVEEFANSYIKR